MFQPDDFVQFLRENPCIRWRNLIPIEDKPIQYLEIGVFKGENVVDVSKTYCKHPNSKMHCVDPWMDYSNYSEYKGKLDIIYNTFVKNMNDNNLWDKVNVYRDLSDIVVPAFEDNFFDLVYIDGNHETEFVYKDGVMSFPKVKSGGSIIFDDYNWPHTKIGIEKFIDEYRSELTNIIHTTFQISMQKL